MIDLDRLETKDVIKLFVRVLLNREYTLIDLNDLYDDLLQAARDSSAT